MQRNVSATEYVPIALERKSLIQQASEEICRFIDARGLKSGDALPAEKRLSEMLGISRASVREAIRVLHGLGVVEKAAGKGALVTSASTAGFGSVDENGLAEAAAVAHEIRMLAMRRCAELASHRLTKTDLLEMASSLALLREASKKGDRPAAKRAHDLFYGKILAGSRNPLLVGLFNQAAKARLASLSESAEKVFLNERSFKQHQAVLDALKSRDAEAAAHAIHKHFVALRPFIRFVAR